MADDDKSCTTLLIRNLDATITKIELEETFGEIGPVKRCYAGGAKRIGYVTFALREDAEYALKNVIAIGSCNISLKFVKRNSEKNVFNVGTDGLAESRTEARHKRRTVRTKKKKGRIIIRNLSFKANEDTLKTVFESFGRIREITIPKQAGSERSRGFAFVHFESANSAAKAIKTVNGTELLERPVAVDWALATRDYQAAKCQTDLEDKKEPTQELKQASEAQNGEESNSGDEDSDSSDDMDTVTNGGRVKPSEGLSKDEDICDFQMGVSDDDQADDDSEGGGREDADYSESGDDDEDEDSEKDVSDGEDVQRPSDVNEGKTLFVCNLSLDTTREKIKTAFSKFGPLSCVVVCKNPTTQRSKGSAFVKFEKAEDARKCIAKATSNEKSGVGGIFLDSRLLMVKVALDKQILKENAQKQKHGKDKRNLYLAREGLIRDGMQSANGVSKRDLAKRTQIQLLKMEMLRNNLMVVSRTRLCVCNLPSYVNNARLRQIFREAGGEGAVITEAKVMRRSKDKDAVSKGLGYVTFTTHEHALKALRFTNNNPDIFTPIRRPIVDFCLENQRILKKRQKQVEASSVNNKQTGSTTATGRARRSKMAVRLAPVLVDVDENVPSYAGLKSDPKIKKMPTHLGPKVRHVKRKSKRKKAQPPPKRKEIRQRKGLSRKMKRAIRQKSVKKITKMDHGTAKLDQLVMKRSKAVSQSEGGFQTRAKTRKWYKD